MPIDRITTADAPNDDCDEELDQPTDEEVARQYVKEHGTQSPKDSE